MSGMIRSVRMTAGLSRSINVEPFVAVLGEDELDVFQRFEELTDQLAVKRRVVDDQDRRRLVDRRRAWRARFDDTFRDDGRP